MAEPQPDRLQQLAGLLREAGRAHHQAFIRTGGEDPEWPSWYAVYLHERIELLAETPLTQGELVDLLVEAEREYATREPDADWPEFYARFILTRRP